LLVFGYGATQEKLTDWIKHQVDSFFKVDKDKEKDGK
jgi:hypothetical protein